MCKVSGLFSASPMWLSMVSSVSHDVDEQPHEQEQQEQETAAATVDNDNNTNLSILLQNQAIEQQLSEGINRLQNSFSVVAATETRPVQSMLLSVTTNRQQYPQQQQQQQQNISTEQQSIQNFMLSATVANSVPAVLSSLARSEVEQNQVDVRGGKRTQTGPVPVL
jgi:hypothetical protein